jgi:predicted ester cyclase
MHGQNMHEQNDIRRVQDDALQALNSEENKTAYFDLHDDSLFTHGIPGNFSADKEGIEEYYRQVWRAFPSARFDFNHIVVEGSDAACMFSITGIQKSEFMGVPPSARG